MKEQMWRALEALGWGIAIVGCTGVWAAVWIMTPC